MPGGRHKDEYRGELAKAVGIPHAKTRKISIEELERRAQMDESVRNLLAPRPKKVGVSPRYRTAITATSMGATRKIIRSKRLAEEVAYLTQKMTGDVCTVRLGYGCYTVMRHCTGEKVEVV